jgi:NAD(P)-dependent dehydrogenase (short-subunit alcohol dehydrogenase family)
MRDRDIPLEEFEKTITINLTASFLLVKGVVEHMKQKQWGRIIFVSSISAKGVGINGCRKYFLRPSGLARSPSHSPLDSGFQLRLISGQTTPLQRAA